MKYGSATRWGRVDCSIGAAEMLNDSPQNGFESRPIHFDKNKIAFIEGIIASIKFQRDLHQSSGIVPGPRTYEIWIENLELFLAGCNQ